MKIFVIGGTGLIGSKTVVALSIVGTDRVPDQGYYRAKVAQEKLIEASSIPYTSRPPHSGGVATPLAEGVDQGQQETMRSEDHLYVEGESP